MNSLAVVLALLNVVPAAAETTRRTLIIWGERALVEWTNGREFGFDVCAPDCTPLGVTRDEADRDLVAARLTEFLRERRELLIYGDDAARARQWYWPGAAGGAAAFLAGLHLLEMPIKTPRAWARALFAGAGAGIALSVGVYGNRPLRQPTAVVHLLTNAPLLADRLPLDDHWAESGAREWVWIYVTTGIERATTAVAPVPSR